MFTVRLMLFNHSCDINVISDFVWVLIVSPIIGQCDYVKIPETLPAQLVQDAGPVFVINVL